MNRHGWSRKSIAELCDFSGGYGFRPTDWSTSGLPIIRIQNLNGSPQFNYFAGKPEPAWLVQPGELLFAWAGSRGVSFGPTIWNGPLGVLNQHIYRVHPKAGVNKEWLYLALRLVTARIEAKAHGFKSTLVHVRKADIDNQLVFIPDAIGQKRTADIIGCWAGSETRLQRKIELALARKRGLMQKLLTGKKRFNEFKGQRWQFLHASEMFEPRSERNSDGAPILSVTQDQSVVLRNSLERRIGGDEANFGNYKLVHSGDFVVSLRSFQGGLEYSRLKGAVSPAYHVIRPRIRIEPEFYRHYFKSYEFIGRLAVAVIGIRDGKQISFDDFSYLKFPFPQIEEQRRIADVLETCDREIELLKKQLDALKDQKRGLMQKLLTGEIRVKVDGTTGDEEPMLRSQR